MIDGCKAAPDDDDSFELDVEPETGAQKLAGYVQATAIVALTGLILFALNTVSQTAPPDEFGDIQPNEEARMPDERSAVPFGAVLPLRAALRDITDPTTTGAIGAPGVTTNPAVATPGLARRIVISRKSRPVGATAVIARRNAAHVTRQAKADNPLAAVGRAAGLMATTFARDLRALPGQISAIFTRTPPAASASNVSRAPVYR